MSFNLVEDIQVRQTFEEILGSLDVQTQAGSGLRG